MADFTSKAIKESFVKLLEEKPLSQITVKDIVEDCGINRNTFYYHYQDVPALMEEIVLDEFNGIITRYPTIDSMEDCLYAVMEFTRVNKSAIMHIFNSVSWPVLEQYLWKLADTISRRYCDRVLTGRNLLDSDKELAVISTRAIIMGLALDWFITGMNADMETGIRRIFDISRGTIESLLDKAERVNGVGGDDSR